jgi:hypothetical protein
LGINKNPYLFSYCKDKRLNEFKHCLLHDKGESYSHTKSSWSKNFKCRKFTKKGEHNSRTLGWRWQKTRFHWKNPKQRRKNIKMLIKKKLQSIEDMGHNLFFTKILHEEETKSLYLNIYFFTEFKRFHIIKV